MSHAETRIISYGIAGSLALHLLAVFVLAFWIAFAPAPKIVPKPPEPPAEIIMPENIEVVPPPTPAPAPAPIPDPPKPVKPPPRRFIDTADNDETEVKPPQKADFISDRNTAASAKIAPEIGGDQPLPTTKGVKVNTLDLTNREYKDGEIKDERSMAIPPSPPVPPPPAPPPPPTPPEPPKAEPPPPEKMAKKEDAPAEKMMKELDAALQKDETKENKEHPPMEIRKATEVAEKTPSMKLPEEPPLPQTMPLPPPTPATKNPQKNEFVPQKRTSEVKGRISNIGSMDSVDAIETAEGRYVKQVKAAISKRWLFHTTRKGDFLQPCDIVLQIVISKDGKPKNVRIVSSNGNAVVTDFTLSSVLEAKIPPIPEDLRQQMGSDVYEMPMEFVVY